MSEQLIPTEILLRRLERAGLSVTRNMLKHDVRDGYLPSPLPDPRGYKGGIGRLWELSSVRRALYLYRLRRRGARGDVLRILLFLRDGWGWERVQPACSDALQKFIDIQRSPVRQITRNPTPKSLGSLMDEIAPRLGIGTSAAAFAYGLGMFGQPLKGTSLLTLMHGVYSVLNPDETTGPTNEILPAMTKAERILADSGMTYEDAIQRLKEADAGLANDARSELKRYHRELRRVLQQSTTRTIPSLKSSNLLTLCGMPVSDMDSLFRTLPKRPTRAQVLSVPLVTLILAKQLDSREQAHGAEKEAGKLSTAQQPD